MNITASSFVNMSNLKGNTVYTKEAYFEELPGPWMYYTVGVILLIVWVIGFSTNFAVLYTFFNNKALRTNDTCLIVGLALSDIGQAVLGIPFVVVSSFQMRWIFGMHVCKMYAFITTMLGISQITTLTFIATERYYIIVKYKRKLSNTLTRCFIVITFSFVYGFLWAVGPLIGWSNYKLEETELACCVTWESKLTIDISYTISICTICWGIPLALILYSYARIATTIYKEKKKKRYLRRQASVTSNRNVERKVAITVLIMIGAFILSWMPYSVFALWSTIGDYSKIPMFVKIVPAIFAKCSIIWNPLIYVARRKQFRQGVIKSIKEFALLKRCLSSGETCSDQSHNSRAKSYQQRSLVPTGSEFQAPLVSGKTITSDIGKDSVTSPASTLQKLSNYSLHSAFMKRTLFQKKMKRFSTCSTDTLSKGSKDDTKGDVRKHVRYDVIDDVTGHVSNSVKYDLGNDVNYDIRVFLNNDVESTL